MGLFLDNFLSLPPLPAAFPGPLEVKCYLEESESERKREMEEAKCLSCLLGETNEKYWVKFTEVTFCWQIVL